MSQMRKKGEERDMNKSIVSVHENGDDHHHFLLTIIIFLFMSMKRHEEKGIERMGVGEKRGKCHLFRPGCNANNFFSRDTLSCNTQYLFMIVITVS